MPRKSREEEPERTHRLSLAELASHDDACSDAMVDNAYFKSQIRKNRTKYTPLRGIKADEIPQILLHKVIVGKDPVAAEKALLKVQGIKRYRSGLRSKAEQENFLRHLRKYIYMYMTDCPWEVSTTNRYTITTFEAAVTARQRIKQNQTITHLVGTLVPLTADESAELDTTNRNFSIVLSGRKKNSSIFLGPARFANHDCDANARLVPKGGDSMDVVATKNIELGDEITVSYGDDYFGPDNIECLCHTCEVLVRNGWAPKNGQTRAEYDAGSDDGESERVSRKRKRASDSPSVRPSPLKSLQRASEKQSPSKLHQSWTPPSTSESDLATNNSAENLVQGGPPDDLALSPPISPGAPDDDTIVVNEVDEIGDVITGKRRLSSSSDQNRNKLPKLDKMTARLLGDNVNPYPPSPVSLPPATTGPPEQPGGPLDNSSDTITIKIESTEATKIEKDHPPAALDHIPAMTEDDPTTICVALPEASEQRNSPEPRTLTTVTTTEVTKIHGSETPSTVLPSIEPTSTTVSRKTAIQIQHLEPLSEISRTPGDYLLTRKLLAQPHDRWVQCQNEPCGGYFLQPNGYQTRRECPRCERHSMLYGFSWPKTDPDRRKILERVGSNRSKKDPSKYSAFSRQGRSGKGTWVVGGGDEEERVMDHRVVHRFVLPEDEKAVTKKGLLKQAEMARLRGEVFEEHFGRDSSTKRTESEAAAEAQSLTPDAELRRRSNRIVQVRVYADV